MALFFEGSYTCRGLCDLEKWSDWNQTSASLLHSCQQVKSNLQTPTAPLQRQRVGTEQASQQHTCRSPRKSQSVEKGEGLRCARDCASHFNALPCLSHHLIASHLISPPIHSLEGMKRFKIQWWGVMKCDGCDDLGDLPKPRPLVTWGHLHMESMRCESPAIGSRGDLLCRSPHNKPIASPFHGCFAWLNPSFWDMEPFPQGLFLLSNSTPGRDFESLVLTWYLGIHLPWFCLTYLAWHFTIKSNW